MLRKFQALAAELGRTNALLYSISRVLGRLGGFASLHRYILVAQPVRQEALLPPHRGRSIAIREVSADDPALAAMPVAAEVVRYRFAQGAICLGAFVKGEMIGTIWLCLGAYDEDEVRCRYLPKPDGRVAWDFDVYIHDDFRTGVAFARLWDATNAYLLARGVRWSMSRISAFNPRSLVSHRSLGATSLGNATFLRLGRWQILLSSLRPITHLSTGPTDIPLLELSAPETPT